MGNTTSLDDFIAYPAAYGRGVIAVGATTKMAERWYDPPFGGSGMGPHIDVSAPGDSIFTTYRDLVTGWQSHPYTLANGTSFAVPMVPGVVAMLKGVRDDLQPDDLDKLVQMSADDINAASLPGWDRELGYGRVNADRALSFLREPYAMIHTEFGTGGTIYSSTPDFYPVRFLGIGGFSDGDYYVKRQEVRKDVSWTTEYCDTPEVWGVAGGYPLVEPGGMLLSIPGCEVVPGNAVDRRRHRANLRPHDAGDIHGTAGAREKRVLRGLRHPGGECQGSHRTAAEQRTLLRQARDHGRPRPYSVGEDERDSGAEVGVRSSVWSKGRTMRRPFDSVLKGRRSLPRQPSRLLRNAPAPIWTPRCSTTS
jgi:hypothetical protein